MITLIVNGDEKRLDKPINLADYIVELGLKPEKVAVERNREIVPKSAYEEVVLEQDDALEIVHFIGGG